MVYGSMITLLLLHLSEPVKLFQMNHLVTRTLMI